jgi:hypothetical protein
MEQIQDKKQISGYPIMVIAILKESSPDVYIETLRKIAPHWNDDMLSIARNAYCTFVNDLVKRHEDA